MFDFSSLGAQDLAMWALILSLPILPNLWAIWHAFHRQFPTPIERLVWMFLATLAPVIGGLAYLVVGRARAKPWGFYPDEDDTPNQDRNADNEETSA